MISLASVASLTRKSVTWNSYFERVSKREKEKGKTNEGREHTCSPEKRRGALSRELSSSKIGMSLNTQTVSGLHAELEVRMKWMTIEQSELTPYEESVEPLSVIRTTGHTLVSRSYTHFVTLSVHFLIHSFLLLARESCRERKGKKQSWNLTLISRKASNHVSYELHEKQLKPQSSI